MTPRAVRAICWDVGGVFTATPHAAIAAVAAENGLEAEALSDAVFGPFAYDTDHPWHRLERGELALRDGWPLLEQRVHDLGVGLGLRDVLRRISSAETNRSVVEAVARDAHDAGLLNAIITNNVREFADLGDGRGWHRYVPLELMRVVVDSSAVGVRKPDPAIYHHTLAELGVEPHQAVFVDDTAVNVEAAVELGMHGVVVDAGPADAMDKVRALAGLGPTASAPADDANLS